MALIEAPAAFLAKIRTADVMLTGIDFQSRSIFNNKRQVLSYPSARMWRLTMDCAPVRGEAAGQIRSFFVQLDGRVNTFECPMPGYHGPTTGYDGPAGVVYGAGQTGFELETDGWTPDADVFRDGDYVTVGDELKMLIGDHAADANGALTLNFQPALRAAPDDDATLEIAAPYFICHASSTDVAAWSIGEIEQSGFRFDGEEDM